MEDLLKKISTYHIFNYLLPGVLFAGIGSAVTSLSLVHQDLLVGVFLYYFYGLVISRLGSIILEPLLKLVRFVKFSDYSDYIAATEKQPLIEELSETNNMYRTLSMLSLCLLLLYLLDKIGVFAKVSPAYFLLALFFLFLFSYRKQTQYITGRVRRFKEDQ